MNFIQKVDKVNLRVRPFNGCILEMLRKFRIEFSAIQLLIEWVSDNVPETKDYDIIGQNATVRLEMLTELCPGNLERKLGIEGGGITLKCT
jgi:hypothetical protein